MKIYIRANTNYNPFNTSKTGMSYYDDFLDEKELAYLQKNKNLTGEIIYMSPSEYYEACANDIFNTTVESLKAQRTNANSEKYTELMKSGTKFPLCVINYARKSQEGLHRMLCAGNLYGWDTPFPVLVVKPYNQEKWELDQQYEAMEEYIRYDFKEDVSAVTNDIADWDEPTPYEILGMLEELIETEAQNEHSADIQVKCTMKMVSGSPKIMISVLTYNGLSNSYADNPHYVQEVWLEDLYAVDTDTFDINDYI